MKQSQMRFAVVVLLACGWVFTLWHTSPRPFTVPSTRHPQQAADSLAALEKAMRTKHGLVHQAVGVIRVPAVREQRLGNSVVVQSSAKRANSAHPPAKRIAHSPTRSHAAAARTHASSASKPVLLSAGLPVTSDVRGNLGPASVVTSENMGDWLKDRWQAASNMQGTAIRGEHWLQLDLRKRCKVTGVVLDFEDAYSRDWSIKGKLKDSSEWSTLLGSSHVRRFNPPSKHHTVQEAHLSEKEIRAAPSVQIVRLVIHRPATHWGVSVWRWQVWGVPESG